MQTRGAGRHLAPAYPAVRQPPSKMPSRVPQPCLSTSFLFVQGADPLASPPPLCKPKGE